MKLLLIHASRFWWKLRGEARGLKVRDEPEPEEEDLEEVVVVFTAVEAGDEGSLEEVVERAAKAVLEFSGRVGCRKVVLYPYAHLSTELARPGTARIALERLGEELEAGGIEVHKAPFGYYKEFILHCKGHPLSEAFRDISPP